jgi:uncharacterized protein (DUF58 family)
MIVPTSRLLLWFALIVLPFGLAGAAEPAAMVLALGCVGIFFVVVAVDAVGARAGLEGITVQFPAVQRLSKDREGKLELRIRNARQKEKTLRLGLPLPREIRSSQYDTEIRLPAASEWSRLAWPCTPLKRGHYSLHTACVEGQSPLGFWAVRKRVPATSEIRVYPNLVKDRKNLAALFLHRGSMGLHAQRQIGKGREFEKLREYVPGDSFDEVHWKATAKRGRPITKVFQIERTQEIYVVIDASRLSARQAVPKPELQIAGSMEANAGTEHATGKAEHGTSTLERFITSALMLGLAAEQQGDLFGLLTFTDKVERFVRAKNGKHHYTACRDALYALQPKIVSPDYDEVCTFIRLRLRRRALLFFLTSLDDPVVAESFVRNADLIRHQHLVLVNMLQPPGISPLFDKPDVSSVDDLYRRLGGHLLWRNLRELEKVLQRRGVHFSLLQNERLSAELVSQYLNVKRRQLL